MRPWFGYWQGLLTVTQLLARSVKRTYPRSQDQRRHIVYLKKMISMLSKGKVTDQKPEHLLLVLQYLGIDTKKKQKKIHNHKTFRRLEELDLPRLCNSTSSRDSTLAFVEEGSHVHMSLDGLMW